MRALWLAGWLVEELFSKPSSSNFGPFRSRVHIICGLSFVCRHLNVFILPYEYQDHHNHRLRCPLLYGQP